ncbi:DHS-like NAD/FAD-binding domain-containing protein [Desarmillaria ectypa]|nr:DHS-like NAD/FAD-binding domain-containing protein [Desarmillaria ectypa]
MALYDLKSRALPVKSNGPGTLGLVTGIWCSSQTYFRSLHTVHKRFHQLIWGHAVSNTSPFGNNSSLRTGGTRRTFGMRTDADREAMYVLSSSEKIIILSGAGLSAASGIPTFRGSGGIWRKYDVIFLATPSAFAENQARVWQFFHYRVSPNSKFSHITQNVDGLCTHALEETIKGLQETDVLYL